MDRPYDFGAVAAANALSDVYAMGARPSTALNLVGFPDQLLGPEVLGDILRGASDKLEKPGLTSLEGIPLKQTSLSSDLRWWAPFIR